MADFFRMTYWRQEGGHSLFTTAERATTAVVEMTSDEYSCYQSTPYSREFPWPSDEENLKRYVAELQRAFELGRQAKAAEVARTIRQLCETR